MRSCCLSEVLIAQWAQAAWCGRVTVSLTLDAMGYWGRTSRAWRYWCRQQALAWWHISATACEKHNTKQRGHVLFIHSWFIRVGKRGDAALCFSVCIWQSIAVFRGCGMKRADYECFIAGVRALLGGATQN